MKGYKTILWNVVNAGIFAMDAANVGYSIPEQYETYWLATYVVGNFVLRLATTGPVGGRDV